MKKLTIMALLGGALLASGCATSHTHGSRFEYKVLANNYYASQMEKTLNDLASDGWTVVTVTTSPGQGANALPYSTIVLKRPKR